MEKFSTTTISSQQQTTTLRVANLNLIENVIMTLQRSKEPKNKY